MLSNLYGWASHDVKNNGADLSVPMKTTEWIVEDKFSGQSWEAHGLSKGI